MGSKVKISNLFWLGRYTERVLTTLRFLMDTYDRMIDGYEVDYAEFCAKLGIENTYADTADFCYHYLFDGGNPDSILSNLHYAYDNAIVLREILTSESLAYIQMAVTAMENAAGSSSPMVNLQWVIDDILAFRGSCYESMEDGVRNIIRCGSSVERIDLYIRLKFHLSQVNREVSMLLNRLYKTKLEVNQESLDHLVDAALDSQKSAPEHSDMLNWVGTLFIF